MTGRIFFECFFVTQLIDNVIQTLITDKYNRSAKRLLLFDYDGTMVPFAKNPADAVPDDRLRYFIINALSDPRNTIAVISGRTRSFLEQCLSKYDMTLIAEHGAFVRSPGRSWQNAEPVVIEWKDELTQLLQRFADECPKSFIEIKESAIVWHYRESEPHHAEQTAELIKTEIRSKLLNRFHFDILEGNKIIELKPAGFDKGSSIMRFFHLANYDFLFAMGDDTNDESMYRVLPEHAVTIKIGETETDAQYFLSNQQQVIPFLEKLISESDRK
jgi:trehalose 6-phosphate synthase/phosphatase